MKEEIRSFIVETFLYNEGTVGDDAALFETGVIDSLGLPQLIVFLEDTYDITMNMMEVTIDNFKSITAIVETVREKLTPHKGVLSSVPP